MHCERDCFGTWENHIEVPMPDQAKTYHPTSFAYATVAVADDLERIAEMLRASHRHAADWRGIAERRTTIGKAIERLDHQAAALRAIAAKMYQQEPTYLGIMFDAASIARIQSEAVPSRRAREDIPTLAEIDAEGDADYEHPPFATMIGIPDPRHDDPDADGPSYNDAPDEPRRR